MQDKTEHSSKAVKTQIHTGVGEICEDLHGEREWPRTQLQSRGELKPLMADVGNGDCFNGESEGVELVLHKELREGGGIGRELGCLSLLLKQWRFQDSQYTGSEVREEGALMLTTNNGVRKSVFFFTCIQMGHARQGRMIYNDAPKIVK